MSAYMEAKMYELKVDVRMFFTFAYYWAFNKHHVPILDIEDYKRTGVMPSYVARYIVHMDEKEGKQTHFAEVCHEDCTQR